MNLDYQVKKPTDLSKINVSDFGELLWWSYVLNTSPENIVTTIDRVGNSTEAVKNVIRHNKIAVK